ncbi:MAG: SGNH/GDSL hydrolase family protein [Spirochaetes bacterium]|nr:SGNH/GDSL hydrolase family protein [Spirochaetota bacterium]
MPSLRQLAFSLLTLPMMALAQAPAPFPPPRKAVECTPRAGLPNFFAKTKKGGAYRVAYLGGSITAQPGYRVKSLAYLNKAYPNCKFTEINAAIGGTGSDLGVLRIDHDVFVEKPDLLFVEFAVNDGGAPPADIVKQMEGIVRKTWKNFPTCDILFVYTFTLALLPDLKTNYFNRSAATMELVADHYGIPSIHMGLEAVRLEGEGKLLMKAPEAKLERVSGEELNQASKVAVGPDGKIPFSKDGVHPYTDTGHQLYEEAIERSVPAIVKASGAAAPYTALKAPMDPKNLENTVMLTMDKAQMSGPWKKMPVDDGLGKSFSNRMDSLWKGEPGAVLSFKWRGTAAKVYDLLGPDCGSLEITVDGKASKSRRIDGYCTYNRLALLGLASGLDGAQVHEVSIKVLDEKIDKEKVLFEHNRADLAKNPAKYEGLFWYAGAIFLVGELVK